MLIGSNTNNYVTSDNLLNSKYTHFNTKIAGVTFDNRQEIIKRMYAGQVLTLKREPYNQYDPFAVAVLVNNEKIGYLSKEIAPYIATNIDNGYYYYCKVINISGGGDYNYGVNIKIDRYDILVQCKNCTAECYLPFMGEFECSNCGQSLNQLRNMPAKGKSQNTNDDVHTNSVIVKDLEVIISNAFYQLRKTYYLSPELVKSGLSELLDRKKDRSNGIEIYYIDSLLNNIAFLNEISEEYMKLFIRYLDFTLPSISKFHVDIHAIDERARENINYSLGKTRKLYDKYPSNRDKIAILESDYMSSYIKRSLMLKFLGDLVDNQNTKLKQIETLRYHSTTEIRNSVTEHLHNNASHLVS